MLSRKPTEVPEDLRQIDSALRDLRPTLPEDRVRILAARARTRARPAVALTRNYQKEPFLRSRIAITFMLVLGFAFSGAGVGLAVTGLGSQDDSSANNQYAPPVPEASPETGGGTTLTPTTPAPGPAAPAPATDEGSAPEVQGEVEESPRPEVAGEADDNQVEGVQQSRQLGAEEGGELPFTGFAAIPVLLLGMVLLTAGFVLRRRG